MTASIAYFSVGKTVTKQLVSDGTPKSDHLLNSVLFVSMRLLNTLWHFTDKKMFFNRDHIYGTKNHGNIR